MLEGVVGGVVRSKLSIEIAQDSDAYGVVHALIVLEGKQRPGISESRKVRCVMPRRIQARGPEAVQLQGLPEPADGKGPRQAILQLILESEE